MLYIYSRIEPYNIFVPIRASEFAYETSFPSVCQIEKQLETLAVRTQKELILLHREGAPLPRHTVRWLNMRSWCSSHHHIQAPKRLFAKKSLTKIVSWMKSGGLARA